MASKASQSAKPRDAPVSRQAQRAAGRFHCPTSKQIGDDKHNMGRITKAPVNPQKGLAPWQARGHPLTPMPGTRRAPRAVSLTHRRRPSSVRSIRRWTEAPPRPDLHDGAHVNDRVRANSSHAVHNVSGPHQHRLPFCRRRNGSLSQAGYGRNRPKLQRRERSPRV